MRQLNHIAIEDGTNKYSDGVMFRNWDRCASVFSALGITGENKARVGMMGSMSAEAIFTFSAQNMVGAEISIVPSYSVFRPERVKQTIRTVPVLYVVPAEKGPQAAESIRQAFVEVYVKNKSIPAENLPSQFMIVDDIPLNPNGKLDIYRITRERLEGDAWNLIPVMDKDQLADIRTEHKERVNSMTGGTLPHGMENNSAYNIFDFFTGGSGEKADDPITKTLEFLKRKDMKPWDIFNPFMHYKLLMPDDPEEKLKMPEIPQNVRKAGLKYVNRIVGIPYGRKSIGDDFEDD